jgi:murein DD-endopeptidase MepM/ murein hydrolase activator NlpD
MAGTRLGRVWAWLHETFPERQVYIRSQGRVQFFTFGPSLQATLAGLSLIFLGWVAFATVNVVFKDRIIAAKDHRYQQMQATYENRVADLQMSYDQLNGALVAAEDRFKSAADLLQNKQNAIVGFIRHENQIESAADKTFVAAPVAQPKLNFGTGQVGSGRGDTGADGEAMDSSSLPDAASGSSQLFMLPGPAMPQPQAARPAKASVLQRAWKRLAALFELPSGPPPLPDSIAFARHPGLRLLVGQTARLARLGRGETLLLAKTQNNLQQGVGNLRNLIRYAGLNPDQIMGRLNAGMGGPDIPIDQVHIQGVPDAGFTQAYFGAAAVLDQFGTLSRAVDRMPFAMPVIGRSFDRTSGFGPRIDPFSGRIAFHPGLDFAGPWGATVFSTAAGVVVFAGNRGDYGNMVEIDHGNGFHTRYGHLSAVTVRTGMEVVRGTPIGRVGSTGRSTGPHVHYEVWYDDVVRNPSNFIEAGRHVL